LAGNTKITAWTDASGNGYNASNVRGDPRLLKSGSHGQPAIAFDGNDSLWTTQKFNTILGTPGYTIFTIARYSGGASNRVFSTRDGRNWLFGYHGNTVKRWYSDGWITNIGGSDTAWHMHIGDIGPSTGSDPEANLWVDGQQVTTKGKGSNNNNTYPTDFQIGGFRGNNEYSKCEVSEVMMFSTVLSEEDRQMVEGYLAHKYKKSQSLGASHPYKNEPPYFGAAAPDIFLPEIVKATMGKPWSLKIDASNGATTFSGYDLPSWLKATLPISIRNPELSVPRIPTRMNPLTLVRQLLTFFFLKLSRRPWANPGHSRLMPITGPLPSADTTFHHG
jgi:hypothetical protein